MSEYDRIRSLLGEVLIKQVDDRTFEAVPKKDVRVVLGCCVTGFKDTASILPACSGSPKAAKGALMKSVRELKLNGFRDFMCATVDTNPDEVLGTNQLVESLRRNGYEHLGL